MNIYNILKAWYEYKAEHSDLTGNHTDFLFYCIDLNNRLAWKEEFGLPSVESAQFLGISYNTFRKLLKDFTEKHKLIRLIKASKNQYTSNVISLDLLYQNLLKQKKSTYKAFVKAQQKQLQSNCDIDIHKDIKTQRHKDTKKKKTESGDSENTIITTTIKINPEIKRAFKDFLGIELKQNKTNVSYQKKLLKRFSEKEVVDIIKAVDYFNKASPEYPYVIESLSSLWKKLDKLQVRIQNERRKVENNRPL